MKHISRKVVQAPGTIKKLSVAVLVDVPTKPSGCRWPAKPVFVGVPRNNEIPRRNRQESIGYDDARGDQITLSNVPFTAIWASWRGEPEKPLAGNVEKPSEAAHEYATADPAILPGDPTIIKKFQQMPPKNGAGSPQSHPALPERLRERRAASLERRRASRKASRPCATG